MYIKMIISDLTVEIMMLLRRLFLFILFIVYLDKILLLNWKWALNINKEIYKG